MAEDLHDRAAIPGPQDRDASVPDVDSDYYITRDGERFAGLHLLYDTWHGTGIADPATVEDALRRAADAAGATVLHAHVHEFDGGGGLSGVVVLAESHISVHSWPECGFAAFDIFICGECDPYPAVDELRRIFRPRREQLHEMRRGNSAAADLRTPDRAA